MGQSMNVKLVCSENNEKVISDILITKNIHISEDSKIIIIEEGYNDNMPFDIKIVFKSDKIDNFIDAIVQLKDNKKIKNVILGIKNGTYTPLKIQDICYFNAINNDTFAHLQNGKQYLVKSKLYQLEEELVSIDFFRINKSELVNMKKISLITPMFKGKLLINLIGYKQPFDISRGYTKAFKERLGF